MGLRDTEEMLEACKADAAQLEQDLALAHTSLDAEHDKRLRAEHVISEVRRLLDDYADATWPILTDIRAILGSEPAASEHDQQ